MNTSPYAAGSVPKGYHTINTYVSVHQARELIEFLKQAFSAEEISIHAAPDGRIMNAELRIGDSVIMIGQQLPQNAPFPAQIYMYVSDVDSLYTKAVQAGGKSIEAPADQPYGDRRAAIEDLAGNHWWIASRKAPR